MKLTMKPMITAACVALITCSTGAMAASHTDKIAKEYLTLTNTKEIINTTITSTLQSVPAEMKKEMQAVMSEVMGWEVIEKDLIAMTASTFTAEELEKVNAFLKTPAGKSYSHKSIVFSQRLSKLFGQKMSKAMQKLTPPKK